MDKSTLIQVIESSVVLLITLTLFFGLKGKILLFAQWAGLPRLALAPVRLTVRYSLLLIGTILILGIWGFELGTILALLGTILGLVAIGFVAVWSVLSNFLCTFVLVAFKPFSVGDEIELPADGVKGKVTDLSLIFTTLQVSPEESVLIPNNTYFQKVFKRRTGRQTIGLGEQLRHHRDQNARSTAPHTNAGGSSAVSAQALDTTQEVG